MRYVEYGDRFYDLEMIFAFAIFFSFEQIHGAAKLIFFSQMSRIVEL